MKARAKVEEVGRLVGYARVSTADQTTQMQIAALTKAGVSPANLHEEQVSGVAVKRPALEAAIADCRAGDTLIVWKLDRIGRSMLDLLRRLETLTQRGVGFRSLTEGIDTTTPGGKLILHVMGALAQFERDLVVERTRAGVRAARARGVRFGQPEKLTERQKIEARKMRRNGMSVVQIAAALNVSKQTIYQRALRKRR